MKLYEVNPHIRYAMIHSSVFNNRREMSVCYDARLFFFLNGSGAMIINGKRVDISINTAVYLPPLTHYKFFIDRSDKTSVITFNFDLISDYHHIASSLGTASERNFDGSIAPKYELPEELSAPIVLSIQSISTRLVECTKNFSMRKAMYRERSSAILKLCLIEMLERSISGVRGALCESILNFISEKYQNPAFTNKEVAEKFNYHPNYLNLVVKRETGLSLREYIIHYRLRMAKEKLLNGNDSISLVALDSGFSSAAYFIKIFKEKNGITPGKYRLARQREI